MDGVDMKEGHVKESVMGVLSAKFEASAGIVGVSNPDNTHHHVERRGLKLKSATVGVVPDTGSSNLWVYSENDFRASTWQSVGFLGAPRTTCPDEIGLELSPV